MIRDLILALRNKIPGLETKQYLRVKPWIQIDGEKKLRFEYQLDSNSIIFDLGGFEGQWSSDIYGMYNSNIYIFEPYLPFFNKIKERFKKNTKIQVFSFGLSSQNKINTLFIDGDKSSLFKNGKANAYEIELNDVNQFVKERNITRIDLMKINIEGGEYDLLEAIIKEDLVKNITNIQIQFHDFVDNSDSRMKFIREQLANTHTATYKFDYVWENWRLNTY